MGPSRLGWRTGMGGVLLLKPCCCPPPTPEQVPPQQLRRMREALAAQEAQIEASLALLARLEAAVVEHMG